MMQTFKALDTNLDGKLSRDELILGFSKLMDKDQAEAEVNVILKTIDKNNNGEIDYSGKITRPTPPILNLLKEWVMATIDLKNLL